MHGRPRKQPKPEDLAASADKAQKLRALQSQFLSNHHQKIYTKEALELSAKLLEINPECYTAWNYRKLAVQHNITHSNSDPDYSSSSVNSILDQELRIVENALRQNFKSYGAWHHRKWVLSKGHSSIDNELRLLDKLQTVDPRNFHAWNYRRFVAALMNRSEEDELKYTQNLIDKNFSNYSAWHNRSVLLCNLMKKKVQGFSQKDEVLTREFELVRKALFTDEDDQSGWFYHLWLLDQTTKAESPQLTASWPSHGSSIVLSKDRCLDSGFSSPFNAYRPDSRSFPIVLYFNQAVEGVNSSTVAVSSGFNTIKDVIWSPLSSNNTQIAQVWVAQLNFPEMELDSVEVTVGHSHGIISSSGFRYSQLSQFAFSLSIQSVKTESAEAVSFNHISWRDENFHIYEPGSLESDPVIPLGHLSINNEGEATDCTWQAKITDEEINNFRELLDSKIGKLTLARLLSARDALMSPDRYVHSEEVLKLYSDLMKLDPTHSRYYKDEYSLILLQKVTSSRESLLSYCFQRRDLTSSSSGNTVCLRLNKLSLSRLGSFEKLLWVQMLDISHNELGSIEGLDAMQLLAHLNLSNNKLRSFTALEPLRQLKSLKVLDISYNEIGSRSIDTTRYLCSTPLSHSLRSEWDHGGVVTDDVSSTNYWEAFFVLNGLNLAQLDIVGNAIADGNFTAFLAKVLPKLKWLDGVQLN